MNEEKLNQLKEIIAKEISKGIEVSNLDFGDLFTNKELAHKALKIQINLDLEKVRNEDFIADEELRDSLRELPENELTLRTLCLCARINTPVPCNLVDILNC